MRDDLLSILRLVFGADNKTMIVASKEQQAALMAVLAERNRQDEKWGEQNHDFGTWLMILAEEIGEASQAALHDTFGGEAAGTLDAELVQVAAVALQIVEWRLRRAEVQRKEGA